MIDLNQQIAALSFPAAPAGLYEPIAYTLASGGKRLRPQLALLGAQLFGGNEQEVLPVALALEVFHNFTLLHDDVMDKATVRRGRPTVHVRWSENTAILSGDQMMIEAYKLLARVREDKLPGVLHMFNDMATGICEGQQYDMDFEQRDQVTLDEYLEMIRLKTALLLAYALRMGAYIAGADDASQQHIFDYGIHLGLAFQIQDDLLDVYGDEKTFGKAIGGDILCRKKTFMLLTALQKADAVSLRQMIDYLTSPVMPDHQTVVDITSIYDRLHVRRTAERAIEQYTCQALQCLQCLPQNETSVRLHDLAEGLIRRIL